MATTRSDEMLTQIEKLTASQRKRMRSVVSSPLDALRVEQVGWFTRVTAWSCGFRYGVDISTRGRVLSKSVVATDCIPA